MPEQVKQLSDFYDPTRSMQVGLQYMQGQQMLAGQAQAREQQGRNMEIDNLRQAALTAIAENPMAAPGLYNKYMEQVGGEPITDPAAFIANTKPFYDQLKYQPGTPEHQGATGAISQMGASTQKRSREEFEREMLLEGNTKLGVAAGGTSDPAEAMALTHSDAGQRAAYGRIFDPNKQAQLEANKQHLDQVAGIKSELGPLISLGLKATTALEDLAPITAKIGPIQDRYDKDVKSLGITKAAGTRRDAILLDPDVSQYVERAKASIPTLEKELAEVKALRLKTTEQAQHIAAGTRPRTEQDNLHVMVGETKAQALHLQYVQAQLALAKDPLSPAKHAAVAQIAKTMDARAGELYQQQTALNVRQDAQRETAREHQLTRDYTNAVAEGQATFGALPANRQTTEQAARIAREVQQSTGVKVKVEDILIKDPNRPPMQVSFTEEKQESKTVGTGFGEQYLQSQKSGISATGKMNKLDRMESLLSGITTGKLTPALTDIQAIGESFGITIDKGLPAKQALQALSREMALELRNPSGGAGMPGAMSDQDREFLQSMTPGLATTNEGNKLIIETSRKVAKRDQEIAKLARTYRQQHGHLDEGFYDQVQAYGDAHPLFKGQSAPRGTEAGPAPKQLSEAEWNKLPSGSTYTAPDGSIRRKK